ncbi:MAG: type IX secretion system sortase PorU [Sphingobacteriaceae bacterium]|nr:type IX secretion system sortase PorU [Sphingobacteriaceae bacterium]
MRFSLFICLFLPNLFLFAQNAEIAGVFSIEKSKTPISNIVKLNASSFEKVVVKNALYDHKKNNLPYFLKSKTNSINTKAIGKLTIVSELKLNAEAANIIKVNFGKYLSSEFQVSSSHGISVNETISSCQIIPFKINELGEVIELIDYSISWDLVASANKTSNANTFKSNSVLASGKWYKLAITRDGVYKLDFLFLNSLGINMSTLDPKNIRIYGNGGVILAEQNEEFRYDDLEENAIVVAGESDNVFNTTDHVLFYGKGMTRWDKKLDYKGLLFSPYNNFYSDTTFYYLNIDIGAGKRIASQNSVATPTNVSTSTYDYYNCHEVDQINFVKSGRNMYGEYFDVNTSYSFVFGDNNFVTGDTIRVESTVAGRGTIANHYNVSVNGLSYNHSIIGFDISNYLADFVVLDTKFGKALNNNATSITASVSRLTPNTVGWIDKVAINARRELVFNGSTFQFRDKRISAPGNICNYNVNSNGISGTTIWNITDIINPYQQNYTTSGSILSFNANADSLNEYVVFSSSNVLQPTYIGTVQNQNLHALTQADYVIISPTQFLPYANRLAALHQQEEGLTYAVATPEQIYNEFSSGKIDASAIRDFTRMLYTRGMAIGKPTKYLLLFGRGSYLNKNGRAGNTNFIPTYETENSVSYIYSVASDDFFGLMDPQEGYVAENDQADAMDVGVGRIIISNAVQADNVVKKIENYYRKTGITATAPDNCSITQNNQIFGDWRNHIMFCADDADGALHMSQADNLAGKVKAASPAYNIDKVYIDAYKGLSTPGGKRYPDMQAAFNNRVEKGCLIMNYTGHGGEVGLSAERVVDIASIDAWSNFNTLPLFITATCEFSRYDDPDRVSAGELCLLNPKGGSIAMLTTCRLAFSNFNETLNNRLFDYVFKKVIENNINRMPALGDIIRQTKASLKQYFFYSNFHLLGDPALTLAYPKQKVYTTHINGNPINVSIADTIKGLSKVTIKGYVGDTLANKFTGFNGLVYPVIYDKSELITCQLNDPASSTTPGTLTPFQFQSQQNIIYKGKVEVKNGDFTFSFIVPKDVSFNYGKAKFSYYATDGYTDANGNYDSVRVGGLSPSATVDTEGPQVKLYLNSKTFVSGGVTDQDPILMAEVSDSTGINTVGTGFGHDITAVLDENSNKPYVLNEYYESNLNSYQTGKVKYQLKEIPEGNHTLSFKIWDVQNNSSSISTDFVVTKDEDLALNMVLNYPNPFTTNTKFLFEHNRNCEDIKVIIQIFTISGKLAKSINRTINCEGFRNEGIVWDGRDDYGDKLGRGVYLYKVAIVDKDNKKAEKIEKLVILN